MKNLQAFMIETHRNDIHLVANYIDRHIQSEWEHAFESTKDKMIELFPKIGDSAYATYNKQLFKHIDDQLKQNGFDITPPLPGDLMLSREWGKDEQNRQRWMWSEISWNGTPIGTIVVVVFHDHEQIRIPYAFQVIALEETGTDDVVAQLSNISDHFREAPDMKTEVEQYMRDNPGT